MVSISNREEIQDWLQDFKKYGGQTSFSLMNRAKRIFVEVLKDDEH